MNVTSKFFLLKKGNGPKTVTDNKIIE